MDLYHITNNTYQIGEELLLKETSLYHKRTIKEGRAWINEFFDNHRPNQDFPSRVFSLYATDTIANCIALKNTVAKDGETPNIYKVEMENPFKAPMSLVDIVRGLGMESENLVPIIGEYWNPTREWKFNEYLSNKMVIREIISADFRNKSSIDLLIEDRKLARGIFNL